MCYVSVFYRFYNRYACFYNIGFETYFVAELFVIVVNLDLLDRQTTQFDFSLSTFLSVLLPVV